jgi:hypothetical protein
MVTMNLSAASAWVGKGGRSPSWAKKSKKDDWSDPAEFVEFVVWHE